MSAPANSKLGNGDVSSTASSGSNEKTEVGYWNETWASRPRLRFPSGLDVGTRDVLRLLRGRLRPGLRYLEIGCAPGKTLAWVGRETSGPVFGLDYSPTGVETARWLCGGLGIAADIRCEDATATSFEDSSFDLVFSCGLIEHFNDPRPMVRAHLRLVAPGGTALIAVPNYRGIYLTLQRHLDPNNLAIHNLALLNEDALLQTVPPDEGFFAKAYAFGRFSPWLLSLNRKLGRAGLLIAWTMNMAAHLQPMDVRSVCPLLVLEVSVAR